MDTHEALIRAFNRVVPLTLQQKDELRRVTSPLELPKGSSLLDQGQVSSHLYFIVEGAVRGIYHYKDKQVTAWFAFEGQIIDSHASFVYRTPSPKSIILLSDCKFLYISHDSLEYLYRKDAVWGNLSRIFIERYYLEIQDRLISMLAMSAEERYECLLQEYPNIENRVNLSHIASYLGIRPETLSKLRKKRIRRSSNEISNM
jgi:CRP/FNR family transcriptional regulator, anaerobic regulatory protein